MENKPVIKKSADARVSIWFTTNGFFEIGKRFDDTDFYENYVLTNIYSTSTDTQYHSVLASWYDENKKFLKI